MNKLDTVNSLVAVHEARATTEYIGYLLREIAVPKGADVPAALNPPPVEQPVSRSTLPKIKLSPKVKDIVDAVLDQLEKRQRDSLDAKWIEDGLYTIPSYPSYHARPVEGHINKTPPMKKTNKSTKKNARK